MPTSALGYSGSMTAGTMVTLPSSKQHSFGKLDLSFYPPEPTKLLFGNYISAFFQTFQSSNRPLGPSCRNRIPTSFKSYTNLFSLNPYTVCHNCCGGTQLVGSGVRFLTSYPMARQAVRLASWHPQTGTRLDLNTE